MAPAGSHSHSVTSGYATTTAYPCMVTASYVPVSGYYAGTAMAPSVKKDDRGYFESLSNSEAERIMKILKQTYNQYRLEQEVKKMATGLKWFLILLGLALALNFDKVLNIIQTAVTK